MRVALRSKHVSMRPASPTPFPTTKKDSGQEVPGNRLCLVSLWALPGAATVELLVVSSQCAFENGRAYLFQRAFSYRIYDAMFEFDLSRQHLSTKMEQRAHDYNHSKQTHTHTPITPPITPMRHASLMTSNCGWKMFHNQIENKTRKRWRYYNTVISFPVAKCDISRRSYSWRPAALPHRTLPCNGATHTWTASFPSGRSTNGATQIHVNCFFLTSHGEKKTNNQTTSEYANKWLYFFLPGANFY